MEAIRDVKGAPRPVGAYSLAVKANGFLFLSGQIGLDPESNSLVSGGVESEARRVMENLKAVLKGAESDFSKVVSSSIFLADINDFKVVNEIYSEYINKELCPSRAALGVKDLPLNARVEISLICVC